MALAVPTERRLLQIAVAIGGLVPVGAGLSGAWFGLGFVDMSAAGSSADSHFRYLSGLLLAIGIAFWVSIPRIEAIGERARLLTAIVVVGGLCRLIAVLRFGFPGTPMSLALIMELVITPSLCLWQHRVAGLVLGASKP